MSAPLQLGASHRWFTCRAFDGSKSLHCCVMRQERLTHQLADEVAAASRAAGVLVVVEARHLCMVARGVEKHAAGTTTIACRGNLANDSATRAELLLGCCVA